MAAAYGIAVTGTMVVTTCLAFIIVWRAWRWELVWAVILLAPFLCLDLFFFGANILRVIEGGWVPLLIAAMIGAIIFTWVRGRHMAVGRAVEQGVSMRDLAAALAARPPASVDGTAVFLTQISTSRLRRCCTT